MGEQKDGDKNGGDNKKASDAGEAAVAAEKKDDSVIAAVFKIDMHCSCDGCAGKIKQSVKRFGVVEVVKADSDANILTVRWKVDPTALKERLEEETKKKVDLLFPQQPKKDGAAGGGGEKKVDGKAKKKADGKKPRDQKPKEQKDGTKNGGDNKMASDAGGADVAAVAAEKKDVLPAAAGDRKAKVFGILHLVVSLGLILAMDKFLKKALVEAAIKFLPSALFGMFCIFCVQMILDSTAPVAATSVMNFFEPALLFIQRWLSSLVFQQLSVAASGLRIGFTVGTECDILPNLSFETHPGGEVAVVERG